MWEMLIKSVPRLFHKYTYAFILPQNYSDASREDQTCSGDCQPIYPARQVQIDPKGTKVNLVHGHFAKT